MSAAETYAAHVDAVIAQRTRLRGPQPPGDLFDAIPSDSSLDKILAVGASVEGRPGVPTRRAGARCHPTRGVFVESGCTQSVAELEEKSAPTRLAASLPPGRGPSPTRMDHLSGTNFVQTPILSMTIMTTRPVAWPRSG